MFFVLHKNLSKAFLLTFVFFNTCFALEDLPSQNYIYCYKSINRFGDNLQQYVRHKWVAYKLNIPLCLQSFEYSDQLMLSELEYISDTPPPFSVIQQDAYLKLINEFYRGHTLSNYIEPHEIKEMKNDKEFIEELRANIKPKKDMNLIFPNKDMISVAVHLRKGGYDFSDSTRIGHFDDKLQSIQITDPNYKYLDVRQKYYLHPEQGSDIAFPLKFPPEQYYIDQIKNISKIFNHKPLYVFIFSDDSEIENLVSRIQEVVNLSNVHFDYRKTINRHNMNVLEDFFSMLNFDCLIRPWHSTFSMIAHILGDFKIVIYPTSYSWINGFLNMESIVVEDQN